MEYKYLGSAFKELDGVKFPLESISIFLLPIVEMMHSDSDIDRLASKIGGIPFYTETQAWPRCACGSQMSFILQLTPPGFKGDLADLMLQLFFCEKTNYTSDTDAAHKYLVRYIDTSKGPAIECRDKDTAIYPCYYIKFWIEKYEIDITVAQKSLNLDDQVVNSDQEKQEDLIDRLFYLMITNIVPEFDNKGKLLNFDKFMRYMSMSTFLTNLKCESGTAEYWDAMRNFVTDRTHTKEQLSVMTMQELCDLRDKICFNAIPLQQAILLKPRTIRDVIYKINNSSFIEGDKKPKYQICHSETNSRFKDAIYVLHLNKTYFQRAINLYEFIIVQNKEGAPFLQDYSK